MQKGIVLQFLLASFLAVPAYAAAPEYCAFETSVYFDGAEPQEKAARKPAVKNPNIRTIPTMPPGSQTGKLYSFNDKPDKNNKEKFNSDTFKWVGAGIGAVLLAAIAGGLASSWWAAAGGFALGFVLGALIGLCIAGHLNKPYRPNRSQGQFFKHKNVGRRRRGRWTINKK